MTSIDIRHGDCLEVLRSLDDNSVDSVVTDPPYGLSNTKPAQVADVLAAWVTGDTEAVPAKKGGFMGKDWDSFVPPPAVWAECLRVLKPGGHMAVFAGARTQDLMGLSAPTREEWDALRVEVSKYGMANAYLQAIPPTGSISYINHSTSSIHPVASGVEIRKEGKLGRVYYPQPHLTNENAHLFQSASTIGYEKLIDTYAVAQHWVDQGQSLTLFFTDKATTRDLDRSRIYAWRKGCKSIYYIRIQQPAMGGTAVEGTAAGFCESCAL